MVAPKPMTSEDVPGSGPSIPQDTQAPQSPTSKDVPSPKATSAKPGTSNALKEVEKWDVPPTSSKVVVAGQWCTNITTALSSQIRVLKNLQRSLQSDMDRDPKALEDTLSPVKSKLDEICGISRLCAPMGYRPATSKPSNLC
ncbi:hypothetical protein B0I35DRAFT_436595 [Stachybotrys elegans]|uniref:Uncharacterized protein n=1 Tax=Stachybotrys elegans TaxID=80388 RepID=A0A8K0WNZ4_9HYPO|nr:hypothetical protein B0I35DRAFT_436595 [Stachybotrys elegans]